VNRDERPKPKQFFYISSALLLALSISLVYASVFVYYPASVNFQGVRPPVIFQAVPGVPAELSPWGTYASVSLSLPLIVANANFSRTLSPWITYIGVSGASWSTATDTTASDGYVAQYRETAGDIDTGVGWIAQTVTIPAVAGSTAYGTTVVMRFRIARLDLPRNPVNSYAYIEFGIYDPNTGSWICSWGSEYTTTIGWQSPSIPCSVPPGTYQIRAEIWVNQIVRFDIGIDYLYISIYSFSGAVLNVNNRDSQLYYAKLTLDYVRGSNPQSLYCEINIGNSQPIQIRGGQIIAGETSEVVLSASSSILINTKCLATSRGSYTLSLTLRYCTLPGGDGVCVFYPLTITLMTS